MKIKMLAHASVLIKTEDTCILTDPWFMGRSFMDSWSLLPVVDWDNSYCDSIDYLWVSHEHPDHFSIPTLNSLPGPFKDRVTVLYQENLTTKMPAAFRRLGFKNIQLLKNRKVYDLTAETQIYCAQVGAGPDSCLGVLSGGQVILNVNDCEVNGRDCAIFRRDMGADIDVVLNQFSIAGNRGLRDTDEHLKHIAATILDNVVQNHQDLGAATTIPFASFVYFSDWDNRYMNEFITTPREVAERFDELGLDLTVLHPGSEYMVGTSYDSTEDLLRFDKVYSSISGLDYRKLAPVPASQICEHAVRLSQDLNERFPSLLLDRLKPLKFHLPDLNQVIEVDLRVGTIELCEDDGDFDISIMSSALEYAFQFSWGISTISVGAKYQVKSKTEVWNWYKIISTLNNAQVYLKGKNLLRKELWQFVYYRLRGGPNQLQYKLKRMREL